jgi:hypothetical protein
MKENILDVIAKKYKTDKSSESHNYTKFYDLHFNDIREKNLKVLEIGIQNGFSLKMWKEYFFNSKIFGIDLTDLKHLEEDRIKIFVGNQSDKNFLTNINNECEGFDIIIDDGSHKSLDIKNSFYHLFPLLNPGGIYVVEDLHTNYWEKSNNFPDWKMGNDYLTFIDEIKNLIDNVNSGGKSGYANRDLDNVYCHNYFGEMNWWDKNLESISVYRSICFFKKV